jgi:ribosomal protein S18 acetylase RimI-like enzyme
MLTEETAVRMRSFTIVAELDGAIVGFAVATPWRLTDKSIVPSDMALQYLAVDPQHRRSRIGTLLVEEIERRAKQARQDVIVAHVPHIESAFYQALGWEVADDDFGYAWLPYMNHMRADLGDPALGFPLVAAKVLRPKAIRRSFTFPLTTRRPMQDAAVELANLIDRGEIDERDLDSDTRGMVGMARLGPPPQALLDLLGPKQ